MLPKTLTIITTGPNGYDNRNFQQSFMTVWDAEAYFSLEVTALENMIEKQETITFKNVNTENEEFSAIYHTGEDNTYYFIMRRS